MGLTEDRAALRQRWYDEGFYDTASFAEHISRGVEQYPDAFMAFVGGPNKVTVTLREMYDRGLKVAEGLRRAGVGRGDKVAVWVPNWIEGVLAYQAVLSLGAVVVPIIHIYGAREVGFILRQSQASVLIMPERWRNIDYVERFEAIDDIPHLKSVYHIGERGPEGSTPWDELYDNPPIAQLPESHPDDVCLLIYTSGTTADPKGVQHTTNTLIAELRSAQMLRPDDRTGPSVSLGAFPAGHIAGVLAVLRMFVNGGSTVLMDQWDPALAARLVDEYSVTASAGAPIHLTTMLDEADKQGLDMSSINGYMCGAASVPPSLIERADSYGIAVYRGYGSSEHPVISSGQPEDPIDKRAHTDGRLMPGTSIRLLDDNDNDVALGADGEIVSIGPEVFVGYTDERLNQESFLPDGWFRTGDIGRLDAEGYLTITDRKKDVIIRGGENIASKEVEDHLAKHPAVVEAAVVGQPDGKYGEKVAAFVILREGHTLSVPEVLEHFVAGGLAKQKSPEYLYFVTEFPRSPSGKVRKVEFRDKLRREAGMKT